MTIWPKLESNARSTYSDCFPREYELLDTGIFDDNRYFDVEIEPTPQSVSEFAEGHSTAGEVSPG